MSCAAPRTFTHAERPQPYRLGSGYRLLQSLYMTPVAAGRARTGIRSSPFDSERIFPAYQVGASSTALPAPGECRRLRFARISRRPARASVGIWRIMPARRRTTGSIPVAPLGVLSLAPALRILSPAGSRICSDTRLHAPPWVLKIPPRGLRLTRYVAETDTHPDLPPSGGKPPAGQLQPVRRMLQAAVHLLFPAHWDRRQELLLGVPVQAANLPQVPPHACPAGTGQGCLRLLLRGGASVPADGNGGRR
jgi:hypothetical protein